MSFDTPDNFYAILGVPIDADSDTLKRAYRQLARRYHPDLAGPDGAIQMKRINRAYDVLSDPEKRLNYDTIMGGVIDLRNGNRSRPRPRPHTFALDHDFDFSGLSIFSTKGPLRTGPVLHTPLGVISALSSVVIADDMIIAAGSLDGKGMIWHTSQQQNATHFAAPAGQTVESLRQLRFSANGTLLAGWGRLGMHVWHAGDGTLAWSYSLLQRAVSAHYSLDAVFSRVVPDDIIIALPLLPEDHGPRSLGVRATDIMWHTLHAQANEPRKPLVCAEEEIEKRQFWAIRLRALSDDAQTLCTLSCARVPGENEEMAVARRWQLQRKHERGNRSFFGGKTQQRPSIETSIVLGHCAAFAPPYTITSDATTLAMVYNAQNVRLYDTVSGAFSELASGTMGGSARMAIAQDAQWLAIAREDSEISEGVVDLWSIPEGRIVQKLYHPWQISSLHFSAQTLLVALTDGTIQVWR